MSSKQTSLVEIAVARTILNVNFTRVFTHSCFWVEAEFVWAMYRVFCAVVTIPLAVIGDCEIFTCYKWAFTTWDVNFTLSCFWVEVQVIWDMYRLACAVVTVPFAVIEDWEIFTCCI